MIVLFFLSFPFSGNRTRKNATVMDLANQIDKSKTRQVSSTRGALYDHHDYIYIYIYIPLVISTISAHDINSEIATLNPWVFKYSWLVCCTQEINRGISGEGSLMWIGDLPVGYTACILSGYFRNHAVRLRYQWAISQATSPSRHQ